MNTLQRRYDGQLPAVATQLFAIESNTRERILKATVTNDTTTVATCTFYLVPTGGSAGDTTLCVNALAVASQETQQLWQLEGLVLAPGDALYGVASVADQLTIHIHTLKVV